MENNLHRNRIHAALSLRWGHYGKLLTSHDIDNNHIYDQVETTKRTNSVLVSFSVKSNVEARQPVRDWFCDVISNSTGQKLRNSPFHILGGGSATCELSLDTHPFNAGQSATEILSTTGDFNHLSVSGNYHHLFHAYISEHRFVASPMGMGFDCYRTYEILMMGSYPIVKTSQLDVMYKVIPLLPTTLILTRSINSFPDRILSHNLLQDWPVLIVTNWSDATPQLLNTTYHKFKSMTWNLERLYNTYWEQFIYARRAKLGGAKRRLNYYLL